MIPPTKTTPITRTTIRDDDQWQKYHPLDALYGALHGGEKLIVLTFFLPICGSVCYLKRARGEVATHFVAVLVVGTKKSPSADK